MVRIHDMEADMAFEHLRHEGIDGAAACGDGMKNLGTFGFGDQGALDSLDLSPDTPHSIQHFLFVADYMSHLENILYPGIVLVKAQAYRRSPGETLSTSFRKYANVFYPSSV